MIAFVSISISLVQRIFLDFFLIYSTNIYRVLTVIYRNKQRRHSPYGVCTLTVNERLIHTKYGKIKYA